MKKTVLSLIAIISLVFGSLFFAKAQELPTPTQAPPAISAVVIQGTLPIGNLGLLKAYARDQVFRGVISINSQSIVNGGSYFDTGVQNGGVESVLNSLRNKTFDFDVIHPDTAKVFVYSWLGDGKGYPFFQANAQGNFQHGNSRVDPWVLSDNVRGLSFTLIGEVPIVIPNIASIQSARINLQLGNDQIDTRYLRAEGNRIFFPTNLVERKGDIILQVKDTAGNQFAQIFNLETGTMSSSSRVHGSFYLNVSGVYNLGVYDMLVFGGFPRDALFQFEITNGPVNVEIASTDSNGFGALSCYIRFVGGQWFQEEIPANGHLKATLSQGKYEIVFDYGPNTAPLPPPVDYGGGKG